MSLPLFVTEPSEAEVKSAGEWYDDQKPGRGLKFARDVLEVFDRIGETPTLYAVVQGTIRRAGLSRFPYSVYYRVYDDYVEVVAVLHDRRDAKRILRNR